MTYSYVLLCTRLLDRSEQCFELLLGEDVVVIVVCMFEQRIYDFLVSVDHFPHLVRNRLEAGAMGLHS